MDPDVSPNCANCGAEASGSFCPACGQEQRNARITLSRWLVEFLDEFSLTARLPKTLWLLVSRPGFLAEEWRSGRRVRYMPALRIYILASVVFFSVTFLLGLPFVGELSVGLGDFGTDITGNAEDIVNSVIARRMQGFLTLGAAASVPLVAFWLSLLRHRPGSYFVDHLIFSLYFHSVTLLALTIGYFALFFGLVGYVVATVMGLYVAVYWARAWWRLYGLEGHRLRSVWRLSVTTGGVGFVALAILITEGAFFGTMIGSSNVVSDLEVANGAYTSARSAYYAGDFRRARYLAELGIMHFMRVDTADLAQDLPYHIAEAYRFADQHDEARNRAESLVAQDSTYLLAIGLAAASAESVGDAAAARSYYGQLLAAVEGGAENTLGHAPAFTRYMFSARTSLGRATPEDMREAAFRTYQRAQYLATDGDSTAARTSASAALSKFRGEDTKLGDHDPFHIAELLFLLGHNDSITTALAPLLSADTTHVLAVGLAGAGAEASGDPEAAGAHFTRMLDAIEGGAEPRTGHEAIYQRLLAIAYRVTGRDPA